VRRTNEYSESDYFLSFVLRKAPIPMQQVIWRIPWQTAWFPDGIPIYGFGLMLFIAFVVCNWLTGRRAARMVLSNIGLGRYVAGQKKDGNCPGGDKIEDQIEAAKALVQDLAIWLFVTGLAGARLTYMYHHPQQSAGGFWVQLIDITNGGIILYGSVIGALAGYLGFCAYLYWLRDPVRQTLHWLGEVLSRVPLFGSVVNYVFGSSDIRPEPDGPIVLNTLRIADLAAPAVALGIGLGRIGCLLNGC